MSSIEAAPAVGQTSIRARFPWFGVIGTYLAITVLLSFMSARSARAVPSEGATGIAFVDGWLRFDSNWYVGIAENGYYYVPGQQSPIAFFPVFPMLVRAAALVVGDTQLAGYLVASLAGLLATVLAARWAWDRLPARSAMLGVAVLLTYPYAFFLHGPAYSDGTYLALAVSAFLLLERRHYLLAGIVGAAAVASRPFGIAVAVGLVVRVLDQLATQPGRPVHLRDLMAAVRLVRPRHLGVLIAPLGLVAWMTWLWVEFGNPLAFVETQSSPGWNQGVGPHTWFKIPYFGAIWHGEWAIVLNLTVQALSCLAVVLLLPRVQRRFGWGYLAYTAIVIAIPIIGTKDFMGAGRYALAAFPALLVSGDWLAQRPRWLQIATVTVLALTLVTLAWCFTHMIQVA